MSHAVTYAIDEHDRLSWVNENWDRFALANDAPQLRSSVVVGTILWSHISDLTLTYLLQKIFARVRLSQQPAILSCRCDAPTMRRELDVYIERRTDASVFVTSTVTSEVSRQVPYLFTGPHGLLRMCSWCNAIEVDGHWVELDAAIAELKLLRGPHHPAITHTLCHRCEERLRSAAE